MNDHKFRRRTLIQVGGALAGAAALGVPARRGLAAGKTEAKTIKIGFVSPQTGPLAPFGEADAFTVAQMNKLLSGGIDSQGKKVPVQIIQKDSQSSPNRAGEVASDLILKEKVDLMLVSSTPETANPVSDACELNELPCISTMVPWQPWFFGRKGDPGKGFNWTYHFFWGLEDVIANFLAGWKSVPTNKKVGALFPNDGDGNAWGDKKLGFPRPLAEAGFTLFDPGRFQDMNNDFSAQIAAFKKEGVEIVTGVVIPPDAKTFLTQAKQQGFNPKVVTLGKALLFPATIEALGREGMSSEVWWSPMHPFTSSLTKQSARELTVLYEATTHKQWTQCIGFSHALFEVAVDVCRRAKDLGSAAAIRDAIAATNLKTVVGDVKWGGAGPFKNVSKTPLVLGQWVKGKKHKFELVIVDNSVAPNIPTGGKLKPLA
jgi:branched-chain amino acid transport system substrate-binding protein